jgi:hypothetical protein
MNNFICMYDMYNLKVHTYSHAAVQPAILETAVTTGAVLSARVSNHYIELHKFRHLQLLKHVKWNWSKGDSGSLLSFLRRPSQMCGKCTSSRLRYRTN